MNHRIIFIAGVHGVGKTTLCRSICSKFDAVHHSASELIAKYSHIEFPPNTRVKNINRNQEALINAIKEYLDTEKKYLLDGHFCLLNQEGVITKIPISTFRAILPMAIILLHDDPSNILSRLKDMDRDIYDMNLLSSFQEQELEYSRSVAAQLNTPYLRANPQTDRDKIHRFIADQFE